jgi:hypothetical protein
MMGVMVLVVDPASYESGWIIRLPKELPLVMLEFRG